MLCLPWPLTSQSKNTKCRKYMTWWIGEVIQVVLVRVHLCLTCTQVVCVRKVAPIPIKAAITKLRLVLSCPLLLFRGQHSSPDTHTDTHINLIFIYIYKRRCVPKYRCIHYIFILYTGVIKNKWFLNLFFHSCSSVPHPLFSCKVVIILNHYHLIFSEWVVLMNRIC